MKKRNEQMVYYTELGEFVAKTCEKNGSVNRNDFEAKIQQADEEELNDEAIKKRLERFFKIFGKIFRIEKMHQPGKGKMNYKIFLVDKKGIQETLDDINSVVKYVYIDSINEKLIKARSCRGNSPKPKPVKVAAKKEEQIHIEPTLWKFMGRLINYFIRQRVTAIQMRYVRDMAAMVKCTTPNRINLKSWSSAVSKLTGKKLELTCERLEDGEGKERTYVVCSLEPNELKTVYLSLAEKAQEHGVELPVDKNNEPAPAKGMEQSMKLASMVELNPEEKLVLWLTSMMLQDRNFRAINTDSFLKILREAKCLNSRVTKIQDRVSLRDLYNRSKVFKIGTNDIIQCQDIDTAKTILEQYHPRRIKTSVRIVDTGDGLLNYLKFWGENIAITKEFETGDRRNKFTIYKAEFDYTFKSMASLIILKSYLSEDSRFLDTPFDWKINEPEVRKIANLLFQTFDPVIAFKEVYSKEILSWEK